MVLQVMKWDIHPDKVEEYMKWTETAMKRTVSAPGVVEFRGYRPASGSSQVVITYEFADMNTWATWQSHEDMQMLRIGYIQGKTKNAHDMKPQCRSFNDNQRTGKVSIKDRHKP